MLLILFLSAIIFFCMNGYVESTDKTIVGPALTDESYFLQKFEECERDGWEKMFEHIKAEAETQETKLGLTSALSQTFDAKNRYDNVFPFDQHRILLKNVATDDAGNASASEVDAVNVDASASRYINASPLRLPFAHRSYILTQGPLADTAGDFWQMVYEQEVSICVMLTNVEENKIDKCHPYFPREDEPVLTFENFECKLESEIVTPNYIIRQIRVTPLANNFGRTRGMLEKAGSHRIVQHFQYITWPDYGVPAQTEHFLDFLTKVGHAREQVEEKTGTNHPTPIVVHCSAGIGRTGTFVIGDSILSMLEMKRGLKTEQMAALTEGKKNDHHNHHHHDQHHHHHHDQKHDSMTSELASQNEKQLDSVEALIIYIRQYRKGLVYNAQQLRFCWKTIVDWINKEKGLQGTSSAEGLEDHSKKLEIH